MTLKYEQIMDKIEVTPEMRQRVLRNVEAEQAKQKKRQLTRRLVTLAACLAIVVCCWYVWKPKQTDPPEQGMMAVAQIDTVDSLEALTEKTGIPMNELTGVPFTVERTEYVSYWDELAEIQYFGGSDSLCYRKSPGTEDNSGDYNVYAQEETLEISGNAVTLKGGNGAYRGLGGVRPAFFVESGITLSVEPDQVELSTSALLAEFTSKQLVEEVLRRIAEGQEDGDNDEEDDF